MAFILIVDDDPNARTLLADGLAGVGYTVSTASDGWQALVRSEGLNVELVIMDIVMPGFYGSGLDVYERLRASPYVRKDLPILFITGTTDERVKKSLPVDPNVRFMLKPLDFNRLRETILELIRH